MNKMVHTIIPIKCKKGHSLPIAFDNNECGCHHNGQPCLIITCQKCLEKGELFNLQIPINKETLKEIKILIQLDKERREKDGDDR